MTPGESSKKGNISATQIILAVLWHVGEGSMRTFLKHRYARVAPQIQRNTFQTSLTRLLRSGFIKKVKRANFAITPLGREEGLFDYISIENFLRLQPTEKWDGGWRFIFFDIPESKRRYRDFLRSTLKGIGFKEFQKSVWVYPYQVPPYLRDLLFGEQLKSHTHFIATEYIEDDRELRNFFGLKDLKRGIF